MRTNPPAYLTPPEVAELLRIRPNKVIAWIRAGRLAAVDVSEGHRPRYRVARVDLDSYLQGRQVTPATPPARKQRRESSIPRYV